MVTHTRRPWTTDNHPPLPQGSGCLAADRAAGAMNGAPTGSRRYMPQSQVPSIAHCLLWRSRIRRATRREGATWHHLRFGPAAILGLRLNWPMGWELCLEAPGGRVTRDLIDEAIMRLFPDRRHPPTIIEHTRSVFRARIIDPNMPLPTMDEVRDQARSYAKALRSALEGPEPAAVP